MSDFDDSCPSSVERGEWIQYYTWFSKQVGMTSDDDVRRVTRKYNNISLAKQKIVTRRGVYPNYSHTVVHHVIAIDDVTEIVKVIIKESIADEHSDGEMPVLECSNKSVLQKTISMAHTYLVAQLINLISIRATQSLSVFNSSTLMHLVQNHLQIIKKSGHASL